ncbi:hypothetical protein, partial [Methylobrevis pamukkalensis]|uniref:hypothetical protein n=1 Tax=Methylobrevis pamukkalensis TaxID=1439726 RepID=UPI00114C8FAF
MTPAADRVANALRRLLPERADVGLPALGALLLVSYSLMPTFSTEQLYSGQIAETTILTRTSVEERLGFAVLHASGVANWAVGTDADADEGPYEIISGSILSECQENPTDTDFTTPFGDVSINALTVAILAAERYNRPALMRQAEDRMADLSLAVTGRMPDYSVGIGQIRLSTAARVLKE